MYNFDHDKLVSYFYKSLKRSLKGSSGASLLIWQSLLQPRNEPGMAYLSFSPCPGLKVVVIDCYELSAIGYSRDHPNYKRGVEILKCYHGDDIINTDNNVLEGLEERFHSWNGGVSQRQLKWLDYELMQSDKNNEMVICCGHIPIHPKGCLNNSLLWNFEQVLDCFNRHPSVVAYLYGHEHKGGYAYDNGCHFIGFNSVIETPAEHYSFANVNVFEDHIEIEGFGVQPSRFLEIKRHKKMYGV